MGYDEHNLAYSHNIDEIMIDQAKIKSSRIIVLAIPLEQNTTYSLKLRYSYRTVICRDSHVIKVAFIVASVIATRIMKNVNGAIRLLLRGHDTQNCEKHINLSI